MIEINNLTQTSAGKKYLKKIVKKILETEKKEGWKISIAFVNRATIKKLNKEYRGKNQPTDVLSFGQNKKFPVIPGEGPELGEIVICPQEVAKNAKTYKSTPRQELIRVLIHGTLHLLGYDHPDGVEDPRLININRDEKPSTRAKLGAGLVPHRNKVSGAGSKRDSLKMTKKEGYYSGKL